MLRLDINLLFTVVNLLIWYAIIRKFLFKPINNVINKREAAIQSRYDEAQKLKNEALAQKEQCTIFQDELEAKKAEAMEKAQEEARAQYQQIVEDAQKKAAQILDASQKEAIIEKEKILGKAEQEIRSIVLDAAAGAMQSPENDSGLYDQFLKKTGGMAHADN